ncbi:MAG: PAS domain S-box protein [Opitutae bacterium]
MNKIRLTHGLATGAALATVAIGLFVLVSWGVGSWRVATFGADYIPMAPSTALLFVVLGLVLGGRLHPSKSPRAESAALLAVGLVALTSALELVRMRVSFPLPWDGWGLGGESKFNLAGMQIGRMAPITAVSFLLAAAALAAEHPAFLRHRSFQWIGRKLSVAGMLIAGMVLLAYVAGDPVGYNLQSVPMALLTAVAFLVLQTGALLVSKANARAGAGATAPADRIFFGWGVTLALAAILGGSFYAGYALLRYRQSAMRQTVQDQLQSIAELKVDEIARWRHERMGDAQVTAAAPGLADFIAQLAQNPAGGGPERAKMEALFAAIIQGYDNYRQIALLDRTLAAVLVFPAEARWDGVLAPATRRTIATTRDVLLEDLHLGEDGHVHMHLIAPVRLPGSASLAAAVVLSINAEQHLFPLVQHWPTPSATGETIIVRREGAEIVYLNELRHRPDSALKFRLPVTDPQLLAAQALGQGKYGPVEGSDYRGHGVLGVALPVPGSDWVIIAKVDRDEAYAPIYLEGRQITLGLGLLVAVVLLFLRSWWQYRHHRQLETQMVAERAARTANERLALVMRHASDVILLFDETQHIIESNDRAVDVYGYPARELHQMTAAQLRAPTEQGTLNRDYSEARTSTKGIRFQTEHRRQDGSVFPVEVSSRAVVIEGRHLVMSVIRDISETKRISDALRESEARFRDLFDLESDAIMLLEADTGRIVQANQAACALYDYTAAELESLHNIDISAEPDATLTTARPENRKLGSVVLIPHRLHRKRDGTVFPVEISLRFFERNGRAFYLAAIRDITLQVAAREKLLRFNAELEERVEQRTLELATRTRQIEALLSAIPDTVIRLRTDGSVLHTQPAKDSPALAALTPGVGVGPADAATGLVAQSLSLGQRALAEVVPLSRETEIATPGGPLAVELRTAPIGTDEFVVFARDISDRKRHETETAALLQKERAMTEMKTRFISVTSHEFRTPMTAALGSVEILTHHLERLAPAKRTELLGRITTSLQRMTVMLDDILLLNRMDGNRVEVQLVSVDLRLQLASIVEEIRLGDMVGHPIKLELSDEIGRFVTDSSLLHHILGNLLSNAVRYSPAGRVITLHGAMDARQLELVVEDQGIGIPAADQERIFEPFERGSNVGTIKGTGLGLNIVKRLIGLLGGTITVATPAAGGCRFTLIFPVQPLPPPKS